MCDTLVALGNATADGSVIFAKNSDREPIEAHHIVIVPAAVHPQGSMVRCTYIQIPQVEKTNAVLLAKPFWIWGAEMGANEHGVVIGNEAVFTKVPYDKKPGLIGMDFIRLALERSGNSYDAMRTIIDLLEKHGQGGNCGYKHPLYYHNSFLIADPKEAWLLETAGKMWAAEKVKSVRSISNAITITNQYDLASADLLPFAVDHGWCRSGKDFDFSRCYSDLLYTPLANGRERKSISGQALAESAGKITPRRMMAILRMHSADGQTCTPDRGVTGSHICMHAGFGPVRASQSVGSMVSQLRSDGAIHWVTGTSAPCTGIFKPLWLDAGIYQDGPVPSGIFDEDTLFWRHELFHQEVLKNFSSRLAVFQGERDSLESQFVEDAQRVNPLSADERRNFSQTCFDQASQASNRWLEEIKLITPIQQRLLYSLAWKDTLKKARFRFKEHSEK